MKKTKPKKMARASKNGAGKLHELEQKIKELNEWRRRLSVLLKFGKRAAATTNLDDLLTLLVDEAKLVLNAERATVFIVDKKEKILWSKVASGTETIRVPMNKGIVGSVCLTGSLENIKDAYKDERFNPEVDKKTGYRTTSILACPMRNKKNQVIGVFQILNCKGGRSFDRQDEELITILADQASGYVENAQLYQDIRIGAQQTIVRLAGAVEYKDHDTSAHLWRMSQYSALIAKEMGFDQTWVETLRLAAPMHDIGKIGVPDAILNKPGKLTPEEWVEMKKHPEYGAKILGGSENELMQMSAEVAWCHHERWDGAGYPRGLKGPDIPIEARIASLADVFDALTSRRIYKPSFSLQETLELINKESGTQFDPTVVEAFHRCLPKIVPIMEEYAPRGDSSEPAKHPGW
jgi:HD-GYP domain-containing protein (c-di-GMP phosphodiesterase class II)